MTLRPAVGVSALAGVIAALSFDPLAIPFAFVVGFALLALVLHEAADPTRRGVAGVSLAFAAPFVLVSIFWMSSLSWGAYLALSALQIAFVAVTVAVGWRVARRPGWPVLLAAVWVTGEWARSSIPFGGFPWVRAAQSAVDTPFAAWAHWVGLPTVSLLVVLVGALLVVAARGATDFGKWGAMAGVVGVLGIGWALPVGTLNTDDTRDVALIQGDTPGAVFHWPRGAIFEKHVAESRDYAARITSGEQTRPDAVFWPENATDLDPFTDKDVRAEIEDVVDALGAPLLVGGLFDGAKPDTLHNAGVFWTDDGPGPLYVKRHPVPFGEFVPFRSSFDWLLPIVDRLIPRDMLPGDEPGLLRAAGTTWGDTICYDIAFDGTVADLIDGGAAALVVQTSNATFADSAQPSQQWAISRMRAIETGRQVLVPSTNGISGVIAADGTVTAKAATGIPATVTETITLADGMSWGTRLSLPLALVWAVVAAIGVALSLRRRTPAEDS